MLPRETVVPHEHDFRGRIFGIEVNPREKQIGRANRERAVLPSEDPSPRRPVAVSPILAPGIAGLSLDGRF